MFASRPSALRFAVFAGLLFGMIASSARGDIPIGPRPTPPPPEPIKEVAAPLKVTVAEEADAQATLVIPRRFVEQAEAAGIAPGSAAPRSNSLPAILGTIAGGGALSLGALLLGVYFLRRSHRKARTAVAGTVAAVTLVIGAGVVLANAPFIPPTEPEPAPAKIDADLPEVTIVIADEGDAIELTLPKSLVQARR